MRIVARVNEEGIAQIQRRLGKFQAVLYDNVTDVMERLVADAVERMQANHQADAHAIQRYVNRTWNLTTSIDGKVDPFTNFLMTAELRADAAYAYDIENGTPRSQPYPFFWQEVYQLEEDAQPELQTALDDAVESVTEAGA